MRVVPFGGIVADTFAQECGFNVLGTGAIGNCGHARTAYAGHPLAVPDGRHGMKEAAEVARPAGHAPRLGVRLTAQDVARVRTLAANLRKDSSRKPLVLGGRHAAAAARALARELRLDLFRIDLSAVVSKYIGETEKNLARLFMAAGPGAAILLLDEADALFGKRTDVKDAHDRYSNAEINS